MSFPKSFLIGASTAAHQVEGNNIHSDYWAQEQMPHSSFTEPSGIESSRKKDNLTKKKSSITGR